MIEKLRRARPGREQRRFMPGRDQELLDLTDSRAVGPFRVRDVVGRGDPGASRQVSRQGVCTRRPSEAVCWSVRLGSDLLSVLCQSAAGKRVETSSNTAFSGRSMAHVACGLCHVACRAMSRLDHVVHAKRLCPVPLLLTQNQDHRMHSALGVSHCTRIDQVSWEESAGSARRMGMRPKVATYHLGHLGSQLGRKAGKRIARKLSAPHWHTAVDCQSGRPGNQGSWSLPHLPT
jgi:hypothetical protein